MIPAIPVVEFAHHADALRVGRPNRETGAGDAIDHSQVRAELVVNAPLVALAEKVEVDLAQRRQKRISVARAPSVALVVGNDQVVGVHPIGLVRQPLEQTAIVEPLKLQVRPRFFVGGTDLDARGVGQQRAHDQPRPISQRMHAEQLVRAAVPDMDKALQFVLS